MSKRGAFERSFIEEGYAFIRGGFDRARVQPLRSLVDTALADDGCHGGWSVRQWTVAEHPEIDHLLSPAVRQGIDKLLRPAKWSLEKTFGFPTREPVDIDWPEWHVDGSWFARRLTSSEKVLHPVFFLSDVNKDDSPTLLLPRSHALGARIVARFEPRGITATELSKQLRCELEGYSPIEATGQTGDVLLMHPLLAHSINPRRPRSRRYLATVAVKSLSPIQLTGRAAGLSPYALTLSCTSRSRSTQ